VKNGKLNVGKIPYANLFPIFHYLERNGNREKYRFVKGVPSELNKMLRQGELDISPSSSIEYLRNKSHYRILPYLSISSSGPINSIFLFSKLPIEELDGTRVAVTSESETSTALLKIVLKEFMSLECTFEPSSIKNVHDLLSTYAAALHIGDTAMSEGNKYRNGMSGSIPGLNIYDLGELWYKHTGLPFVYALWVIRKQSIDEKDHLIRDLSVELLNAKQFTSQQLSSIAKDAPHNKWIQEEELVRYWQDISYDFTRTHMEGLKLFEKYALKTNVLY
jgi:chorismate dehydratase